MFDTRLMQEEAGRLVGEDGLALAEGAAEFLQRYIDGIPEGYSVRLEVERSFTRDEVRLEVGKQRSGYVTFAMVWRGGRDDFKDGFELLPIQLAPTPFG